MVSFDLASDIVGCVLRSVSFAETLVMIMMLMKQKDGKNSGVMEKEDRDDENDNDSNDRDEVVKMRQVFRSERY